MRDQPVVNLGLALGGDVVEAARGVRRALLVRLLRALPARLVDQRRRAPRPLHADDAVRVARMHLARELARVARGLAQGEASALVALVEDEGLAPFGGREQLRRRRVHLRRRPRATRRAHRENVGLVDAREEAAGVLRLHPEALRAVGGGRRVARHGRGERAPRLRLEARRELWKHARRRTGPKLAHLNRRRVVELDHGLRHLAVREVAAVDLVLEAHRGGSEPMRCARCRARESLRRRERRQRRCVGQRRLLEGEDVERARELFLRARTGMVHGARASSRMKRWRMSLLAPLAAVHGMRLRARASRTRRSRRKPAADVPLHRRRSRWASARRGEGRRTCSVSAPGLMSG